MRGKGIEFEITLQGHDWENDLHFNHRISTNMSLFKAIPESLLQRIEISREGIEREYKDMIIKKGKHIKRVK